MILLPPQESSALVPFKDPRQLEIWQLISQHEGGWIAKILKRPVLIWGAQGSWKSYFAAYLALLRKVFYGMELEISDPHLSLNSDEAWAALLKIGTPAYGDGDDYGAIALRLKAFYERMANAKKGKLWHCPIFDEVSEYSRYEVIRELSELLILKCSTRPRKAHEAPILIAHNITQSMTGGGTGTQKAFIENIIQLHLLSTSDDFGEFIPLFQGELRGLPDADGIRRTLPITLNPDWMHPEYLLKRFSEYIPQPSPSRASVENFPQQVTEKSLTTADVILGNDPKLLAVWNYAKAQNRPIKAAEIQQNVREFQPKDKPRVPTSVIREYFLLLETRGYGQCAGEGDRITFLARKCA